ncbi:hypothetical protein F5X99DRAFT_77676 [Biscogniauxia marginata]|nr:hypothetical protein F5X99DRAFT_77676 [Biscogniauxia marginata]
MATPHRAQLTRHCAEAASSIRGECVSATTQQTDGDNNNSPLAGCGPALVDLLSRQAHRVHSSYRERRELAAAAGGEALTLKRLEDLASIAYAKFYAFLYKDLPVCWRQLYTDARILKFCLLVLRSPYGAGYREAAMTTAQHDSDADDDDGTPDELVRTLDLAVILAGAAGEQRGRRWIDTALELLRLAHAEAGASAGKGAKLGEPAPESEARTFSTEEPFAPPVKRPVRRVAALSMEDFQTYMDRSAPGPGPEPFVMRGAIDDWPALTGAAGGPWNRPSYLLSRTFGGRRLVPVEVGRSYVDEGWGQKLVTFGEFLRGYIDPSLSPPSPSDPKPTAYLAQHPLFAQLPSLRADILIPDYCYTSPPPPPGPSPSPAPLDAPLLNAWFGPPGTITPLHTDPYHNVLAQVVGRKYVRLYAPSETPRMAARGREAGVEMGNTSRVDVGVVEGWDRVVEDEDEESEEVREKEKERFRRIPFVDCILEPGDVLYIPVGWWHYVRGLSVSFSVSFWWN